MSDTVHAMADQLRQYATHFVEGDWNYTRQSDIKHIRRHGDWSGYDHPLRRCVRLVRRFVKSQPWERDLVGRWFAWKHPIVTARSALRTQRHHPDGVLDGGNIITNWEEHGEYLQYVQPSVGALLADLMDRHADLPEVLAIAAEMKRINDDYGQRVAAEESA